jgi:hypothetical protein
MTHSCLFLAVHAVFGHLCALSPCACTASSAHAHGGYLPVTGPCLPLLQPCCVTDPPVACIPAPPCLPCPWPFPPQFLESYKSVTLDSMATAFDVGLPFLDSEISDFICAGRISAKIDKVHFRGIFCLLCNVSARRCFVGGRRRGWGWVMYGLMRRCTGRMHCMAWYRVHLRRTHQRRHQQGGKAFINQRIQGATQKGAGGQELKQDFVTLFGPWLWLVRAHACCTRPVKGPSFLVHLCGCRAVPPW